MKEFVEKLIASLEECEERYDDVSFAQLSEFGITLNYKYAEGKRDGVAETIKIVNELAESYHIHCEQEYMKGYEDARQCGGWIPCSERLPEVNTNVIAQFSSGVVSELLFNEKGLFQGIYEYGPNVIVAWQPLPEPYKPQESEWKDKVMKHFTKTE